jgi:DNA polymerase III epsilon subunit-like protein
VGHLPGLRAARSVQPRNDDEPQLLIFDTETSDLPRNWNRPASDVDSWPRLVQIAWVVCDLKLRAKHRYATLVRPDGWVIAPGAARVHGISTERALRDGVPVAGVLAAFDADLWASSMVIAHNLEFDEAVMTAEFIRSGIPHHFDDAQGLCTMRGTTGLCKLEPKIRGEYKWPKLSELHETCTGRPHAGAHDAAADVEAVLRCLEILKRKRILQIALAKGN